MQIQEISTANAVKHGSAKISTSGVDIFTNTKVEE